MHDFKAMADAVIESVKSYVSKALEPIDTRLSAIDNAVAAIPAPVEPNLEEIAKQAAALIEPPKVDQDEIIKQVAALIRQPEDGKSVTIEEVEKLVAAVIEKSVGNWALDFERRAQDLFQKAADKMPIPKNGTDGFNLEDFALEYDGERSLTFKFSRGEVVKEFPFTLPVVLYRGVFKEGDDYTKSDSVTFGGSLFISQKDFPQGKPGESDDWKLSCKRGRDGKNYEPREPMTGAVKL